jgi:hypothetical protein
MSADDLNKVSYLIIKKYSYQAFLLLIIITVIFCNSYQIWAYLAPNQSYPLKVTYLGTFTYVGMPQSEFTRGSIIKIEVKIEHAIEYLTPSNTSLPYVSSQQYSLFLIVSDPEGNPITFHTRVGSLSAAESLHYHFDNIYLPSNLPTGKYTYKILIWTTSLPEGGPLSSEIAQEEFILT